MGVRASIRDSKSENKNYINNVLVNAISSNYTYKRHLYMLAILTMQIN